jgi:hypothetical protein
MAAVVMTVLGIVVLGLGVWGIVAWSDAVLLLLKALVALGAVLFGVVLLIFGISELAGRRAGKATDAPPPEAE